ncbi:MAG TPA: TIGR02677 family protein [Streptosporangiaceae bacterium]|nr:TIGR02677 family protein [Streptosporangiaceae bacterium]
MADQTEDGADQGQRGSLDLDALAVSDRFRLFNFTRRDDHVAYLWVLRALDRLRAVHQVQAHSDDVAAALAELAAVHLEAPRLDGGLREKLDALADDGMVHRLEDASRAGSLARYRNRQSVYQFSELGYRAFAAVEDVLSARIRDANLSRLVFSDILDDLRSLAAAVRDGDGEQVYRRLSRLDAVLDDMSRRAAQFHLMLGEIMRSTDTSPDAFLRYKNALLTHMTDFMAELDRYLPRLAASVTEIENAGGAGQGTQALLRHAAAADERPLMGHDELVEDWRRRWAALRAWFAPDELGESRAGGLRTATRAAVSGVIALLRQVTEAQRGGVNRSSQLRHLAAWVFNAPDEGAAYALMSAALNLRSARHLGGAHDDAEQISQRATWWDAPGVDISVTLFRRGKAPTPGVPQPVRSQAAIRAELRRRQSAERAAERAAAGRLLEAGAHGRILDDTQTRVLLRLLTLATEARTVVAGRVASGSGGNDVLTMRLVPSAEGSAVLTENGVLHLPGFRLELAPAGPAGNGRR